MEFKDILNAFGKKGPLKKSGDGHLAHCTNPEHEDKERSLYISRGVSDKGEPIALVHCHAFCPPESVVAGAGLRMKDLFLSGEKTKTGSSKRIIVARYDYFNAEGELLYQVQKTSSKEFPQRRPDGKGGWVNGLGDVKPVLYRLPQVIEVVREGKVIFIPEGEKDVDNLAAAGLEATCNPMGSGAWRDHYAETLAGAHVVVLPDNDDAGRKHAESVCKSLHGKAASVKVLQLPDLPDKGDVTDWLQNGGTAEKLLSLVEETPLHPSDTAATAQPPPLAYATNTLKALYREVRRLGLVGEERNAQVLYLTLTSRLLSKQVSVGVKGHSSSGKSYVVETITKFFPPEAYLKFTAMSERALIYSTAEFKHRTIVVYELVALREGVEDDLTSYFIRSLLSEGRIDYEVTVRSKEAGYATKRITKEGPTNLIFTTTKTQVHAENETRILSLNTDDSNEQTARVLLETANENTCADGLDEWRALQAWLSQQDNRVTIPYARKLAGSIAPVAVRLRRDFSAILVLIRAHAVLHQATREKDEHGQIIATMEDYAAIRSLVADVIAEGVGKTVSQTVRETVRAVAALEDDNGVMVRSVAEYLDIDKSNAGRRLRVAADGGYVRNLEEKRGMPGRWVVGDPLPEQIELLPLPSDLSGCAVALESEGNNEAKQESSCAVALESEGNNENFTEVVF